MQLLFNIFIFDLDDGMEGALILFMDESQMGGEGIYIGLCAGLPFKGTLTSCRSGPKDTS